MRGNPVSHRHANLPQADANHVKVFPGIRGAGATLSRNTESHHDGNQTDRQPVRHGGPVGQADAVAVRQLLAEIDEFAKLAKFGASYCCFRSYYNLCSCKSLAHRYALLLLLLLIRNIIKHDKNHTNII